MATQVFSDSQIKREVLDEFVWDPRIESTDVGVEVDDGVVTLTGVVPTYAMKLAAEHGAQKVRGVRAVASELSVRTSATWNDTDIAKAVAHAIESNVVIPEHRIKIEVKNGKVTLTGEVDWDYQRSAAANSVRYLRGVRTVSNFITLRRQTVAVEDVKRGIEQALLRDAEVDADRIHVLAAGDHITLTGTVRSWPERNAAELAAWNAAGVEQVTNRIDVRPA